MARGAFTLSLVQVDYWLRNAPPGSELEGDVALVGPAGTGAFSGHNNELAYFRAGAWGSWVAPSGSPGLRGCFLHNKDGASGDVNKYFGHDGTVLQGPFGAAGSVAVSGISFSATRRIAGRVSGGAGNGEELNFDDDATLAAASADRIPSQLAVKTYVDSLVAGLKWKVPVRVATTAAGTLATSFENGDTIDGIVLATGNRILIKNQADPIENGIYTVNASGAPTRATDADVGSELVSAAVFVQEGTANADKAFVCTNDSITLGATSITFVTFLTSIGGLLAANNLNDLTNVNTAQMNLDVYNTSDVDGFLGLKLDISKTPGAATFLLAQGTPATTGTNKTSQVIMPFAGRFKKAWAAAKTGPTGADLIVDINKNASTIWSTAGNRLKIVAGATTGNTTTFDTTTFAAGDLLTIDIDQIGSTIPGQDVTIMLAVEYDVP